MYLRFLASLFFQPISGDGNLSNLRKKWTWLTNWDRLRWDSEGSSSSSPSLPWIELNTRFPSEWDTTVSYWSYLHHEHRSLLWGKFSIGEEPLCYLRETGGWDMSADSITTITSIKARILLCLLDVSRRGENVSREESSLETATLLEKLISQHMNLPKPECSP